MVCAFGTVRPYLSKINKSFLLFATDKNNFQVFLTNAANLRVYKANPNNI